MEIIIAILGQESANCSPKARSGPLPVLSIKFYWITALLIHFCIIYSYFHTTVAESNSRDRAHRAHRA